MKSLLKDMFYQRFSLENDSVRHQEQLHEVSSLIERNEEDLKARLNTEEQEVFEKYLDCTNEIRSLECCDEFVAGFRLGGRIVMEIIFGADDSELRD
jgi:hypothetical protein